MQVSKVLLASRRVQILLYFFRTNAFLLDCMYSLTWEFENISELPIAQSIARVLHSLSQKQWSCGRSHSPRGRSPRRRSISPRRGRSYSRSPPHRHAPHDSPYANGYVMVYILLLLLLGCLEVSWILKSGPVDCLSQNIPCERYSCFRDPDQLFNCLMSSSRMDSAGKKKKDEKGKKLSIYRFKIRLLGLLLTSEDSLILCSVHPTVLIINHGSPCMIKDFGYYTCPDSWEHYIWSAYLTLFLDLFLLFIF